MRLFNTLFNVLYALLLCSSLMYCNVVVQSMCMLLIMVVYVNICIVVYKLNVDYSVYVNSVSVLY